MQDAVINEVVRRLVNLYQPERVYLFGSAARGDSGPDSDLDLCIVLPQDAPPDSFRRSAHRHLWGMRVAVDVVKILSADFDRRSLHVKASLSATILREGRLLYDARPIAA